MMASFLNKLGLVPWFSKAVGESLVGVNWLYAFLALSLVYLYSHYLFASNTAHVGAMYAAFLGVSIAVGTPPLLAALVLGAGIFLVVRARRRRPDPALPPLSDDERDRAALLLGERG